MLKNSIIDRRSALAVLGLHAGAASDDFRKAYRTIVWKLHPDHSGFDSAEEFAKATEAYNFLKQAPIADARVSTKTIVDRFYTMDVLQPFKSKEALRFERWEMTCELSAVRFEVLKKYSSVAVVKSRCAVWPVEGERPCARILVPKGTKPGNVVMYRFPVPHQAPNCLYVDFAVKGSVKPRRVRPV